MKQKRGGTNAKAGREIEQRKRKDRKLAPEGKDPIVAPIGGKGMVIGYVEDIHGDGGVECEEYKPTRHELQALATHWAKEIAGTHVWWFYTQTVNSSEMRLEPYAYMRLKRIADSIGQEAVTDAFEKAWEAERKQMGEEDWRVFTEGTKAERDAVADRTCGRVEEERRREEALPTKVLEGSE